MKKMNLHSSRIKVLIVMTLMLAVFASAFGESFDDWYDDAVVVNTNIKTMGPYTVSVKGASNDYKIMFSVSGERGNIACYNGKYQYWEYRRGFGYQDWITPAFDMSQIDLNKFFTKVDSRITLNRTGLDSSKLSPLSAYVDIRVCYDDNAVINSNIKTMGPYSVSVKGASNDYKIMFSVSGERGNIACYNGKYQYWEYRRGFGYQDWITPAFDMSQIDLNKFFTKVDARITLDRNFPEGVKELTPLSKAKGVSTASATSTNTTSTSTSGKTNTTTATATASTTNVKDTSTASTSTAVKETSTSTTTNAGKTSTSTSTSTATATATVVRPTILATPDETGGWYDDKAEWDTSITKMGPYTVGYNIQKGKFALVMISYPGDTAYIGCYDLMYQYWHYRRGYNGYQAAFDPYFDMSQWDTSKFFKKVDKSITLDRHVSGGETTLKALSTKIVPYTRPDELSDIGIDGKRFEKTSFVKIPEITIIIGSGSDGIFVNGRSVVLTPYIIGKYEVTQELYQAVTGKNPSKGTEDNLTRGENQNLRPVEKVELFEIAEFCNKLSVMQGLQPVFTINDDTITADITKNGWRVPTEAEWECAARGGNPADKAWNYMYAGTNSEREATDYMWIKSNSNDVSHEVGLKKPNTLGLYDMLGNVYEWCLDWYDESINKKTMINPTGPASGTDRVQRSTAYGSKLGEVTKRDKGKQDKYYVDLGFRLCRTAD